MSINQGCIHSVGKLQYFKPYACGICNLRPGFSNLDQLDDLFENHYAEVTAPKCCHCMETFTDEKSLLIHIKAKHKLRRSFCSAPYENFRRYLKTRNGNQHMCPYCHKKFYSWKDLSIHMRIHEKPMRCKICGKKFSLGLSMRQHIIHEHAEEECDWLPSRSSTDQGAAKTVRTTSQKIFSLIFGILFMSILLKNVQMYCLYWSLSCTISRWFIFLYSFIIYQIVQKKLILSSFIQDFKIQELHFTNVRSH